MLKEPAVQRSPDIFRQIRQPEESVRLAVTGLKRISKPGLRVYAGSADVPKVFGGLGTAIISTNHGVITDKEARKLGVGGEVLCYVW